VNLRSFTWPGVSSGDRLCDGPLWDRSGPTAQPVAPGFGHGDAVVECRRPAARHRRSGFWLAAASFWYKQRWRTAYYTLVSRTASSRLGPQRPGLDWTLPWDVRVVGSGR